MKIYLFCDVVKRCRSQPVPIGGGGNVQEDRKRRPRLVPRVKEGYVRDVASESDLPIVQVVESGLVFQLEGEAVGYLLEDVISISYKTTLIFGKFYP